MLESKKKKLEQDIAKLAETQQLVDAALAAMNLVGFNNVTEEQRQALSKLERQAAFALEVKKDTELDISQARYMLQKLGVEIADQVSDGEGEAQDDLVLDEGEGLLYFPQPRDPVSAAFRAITDASGGGRASSSLEVQLDRYVLWARFNASLTSGTADRSGIGAGAQAGVVVEVDPRLDVGGFVMGYASRQETGAVDGTLDSASLGGGLYVTYDFTDTVTAGLTLSGERGFHDSSVAGVTGSFTRDMLRLEGDLSGDYQVGDVTVTPRAGFEWLYSSRSSYVDSSSLVHPTITANELIGTLGIEIRQSFVQEFGNDLLLVTPRGGLAVNGHAGRDETLDLGGGVTVEQSALYLTASTGIAVELGDGMTADFGLSLSGIGDSLQSVSATASLRAPLN